MPGRNSPAGTLVPYVMHIKKNHVPVNCKSSLKLMAYLKLIRFLMRLPSVAQNKEEN
jgi:hypothetical protein